MRHFLLWRFCHEDSVKASLLYFIFLRRNRESGRVYFVRTLCHVLPVCLLIVLLNVLLGTGFAEGTFTDRMYGNIECGGSTVGDGNIKCDGSTDRNESRGKETKEEETLFIAICDTDGVKRLLSSEHPAILTQGLYFSFPKDVKECEICQNDGAWIKTAERVYLDPKQTEDMVIRVRFRAKGSDGSLRYSRSFVLVGSG
ncbi:MAG: hypothetical protein HDR15_06895 [Lachnospiraceae bacterium]|nr:hypothetical protein [Lachnospiraceae bacterium]